jgi:predicted enzyme related to lactoylglutathione lyase
MPKLDNITIGIPGWVDAAVETTEQREALMKFYSSLYGWTWDVGEEQMGYYSIASYNGAAVMGLGQGPGGAGMMVPYFYTDDINISAATAASLGGTVFMGPMEIPGAGVMALVTDPTGAVHGLWQAREFQGFGVAYEANAPGWFDHSSSDPDAAATYYSTLTGHTVIEPSPGMKVLNVGEQWFASVSENQVPERQGAQWNSIYVVDTLAAARDKIRELGGTIVLEEMPVPGSAICAFVEPVMNTVVTIMGAGSPE